jgi:hypothetical protein
MTTMFGRRRAYATGPTPLTSGGRTARPAAGTGRFALARAVRLIAGVVALIIVAGILLVVLGANPSNSIVRAVHDAASWLAGPFKGLFTLSHHKAQIAVNWGLAAVVWYAVGHLIARLLSR